jgi:uncharacterized membrane protein
METELWAMGVVTLAAFIGAMGPIFLKRASRDFRMSIRALIANRSLILGIACYGTATVLFVPALRGGELSTLYPLVSTTYIWVSLLSVKLLKERMNRIKWLGILLIIAGVSFIGFGS